MDETSSKRPRRSGRLKQWESVNLSCVQAASVDAVSRRRKVFHDSNATNIFCLPDEVMQDIFSYLHVRQRMRLGCVCQKWLSLIDCHMMMKDIRCRVTEDVNIGKECSYFTRKFTNFRFLNCTISHDFCEFLEKYGKNVKKLTFDECNLRNPSLNLISKASQCLENLEELHFLDCYLSLFYHLPALQLFHVHQSREKGAKKFFTNREVVRLDKTMPDLKVMNITIIELPAFLVTKRSQNASGNYVERDPLRSRTLIRFLEKRKASLHEFSIMDTSNVDLVAPLLSNLCQMENSELKTLKLWRKFASMNAEFCINTCKNLSALRRLELLDPGILNDDLLNSFCNLLPNLQKLLISGILDTSIVQVFKLRQLRSLHMWLCIGITSASLRRALSEFQLHNLRKLSALNTFFENDMLVEVFEKMHRLTKLKMSFLPAQCYKLSDQAVQSICKNLVHLRTLQLNGGGVGDEALFCPDDPEKHITHIKGLRTLKLLNTRVTRQAVLKNLEFLELQTLKLSSNPHGKEKYYLNRLRKRNPSLLDVTL